MYRIIYNIMCLKIRRFTYLIRITYFITFYLLSPVLIRAAVNNQHFVTIRVYTWQCSDITGVCVVLWPEAPTCCRHPWIKCSPCCVVSSESPSVSRFQLSLTSFVPSRRGTMKGGVRGVCSNPDYFFMACDRIKEPLSHLKEPSSQPEHKLSPCVRREHVNQSAVVSHWCWNLLCWKGVWFWFKLCDFTYSIRDATQRHLMCINRTWWKNMKCGDTLYHF